MKFLARLCSILLAAAIVFFCTACNKRSNGCYQKENACGTGYGAGIKSCLYIEDFYFVSVGTLRTTIEQMLGSPHYTEEGNSLYNLYELNNGDSIGFTYDKKKGTVNLAEYIYSTGGKDDFFNVLVDLGVLKSKNSTTTVDDSTTEPSDNNHENEQQPNNTVPVEEKPTQTVTQGDVFASGEYNFEIIKQYIEIGFHREDVLDTVGKPNYFYSHNFASDSYIIDCYILQDGSKLMVDYGYERDTVRCAAVYKSGTYESVVGTWSINDKPNGFTRPTVNKITVGRLSKNLTPTKVYKSLGEPSWYEGDKGNYTDVYALPNGEYAYLSFGSAHNKLTSASIISEDGTITVITLN